MKINYRMWLASLLIVMSSLTMSATVLACDHGWYTGGKIYNEADGKFYSAPSRGHCMVYRSVNGHYIPVGHCDRYCKMRHHHGKYCRSVIGVRCEVRPAHWWQTTWMPVSRECWYVR
jgi:hypothetical protein